MGSRKGQHSIRINAQYRICFKWTNQGATRIELPTATKPRQKTKGQPQMALSIPIPTHRPPTPPGEMIAEEFLKPLDITQQQLAEAMKISRVRLNAILNGHRAVTPDTALRLERVLGPSARFWLNLQMVVDLYETQHSSARAEIEALPQLVRA